LGEKLSVFVEKRNSKVFLRPRFTIDLDKKSTKIVVDFSDAFKNENCKSFRKYFGGICFYLNPYKECYFLCSTTASKGFRKYGKYQYFKGILC